jgi:hypothetical protein
MAAKDIKDHQFTSKNQPKNRRSRKGVPNRARVYKKLLNLSVDVVDPQRRTATIKVSLYEAMALGQIRSAMQGNTRAWIEIQDSLFGKQLSGVNFNITAAELEKLSDEQLDALGKKLDRGYVKTPTISIIEAGHQFETRREDVHQQVERLDDDGS